MGNIAKRRASDRGFVSFSASGAVTAGAAILGMIAASNPANAFNLYDGSQYGNDMQVNLTTTVSYTGQLRVNSPSAFLKDGSDGDANFQHGIVGNLFEILPVLDIVDGNYGAHFSGQAYINTPYLGTNQNNVPGYSGALYTAKQTDFASATRNVDGLNAQLLDAFAFAQHQFADGQSIDFKIGRQTLFWGQSLFFPSDGISGGQAPINVISAQNQINAEAQQVFMPVGQVVFTYQPIPGTTLQTYYQFEYRHDYLQGEGAYFNGNNLIDRGGSFLNFGGQTGVMRSVQDNTPPNNNGQFGLSIQQEIHDYDLGLFVERFDAKAPEIGYAVGSIPPMVLPHGYLAIGTYDVVYPRDIWLQGVSASTNIGAANVAGELSFREHQPLFPANGLFTVTPGSNANGNPAYPVGTTWNAQVSAIYLTSSLPLDPGGIAFTGEAIMNHLISVTDNRAALVTGHQGTAAAFDVVMTPTYNDVLPFLNLTFPIGIDYNFLGRSVVDSGLYHGTGTFNVGVTGTYRTNWIASLSYQDYFGKPDVIYNALADRGYVALNLQHTF